LACSVFETANFANLPNLGIRAPLFKQLKGLNHLMASALFFYNLYLNDITQDAYQRLMNKNNQKRRENIEKCLTLQY